MNIKDIALIAKVSPSTVSKIINNKDKDISDETRKKVLQIIKDYQYVPYSKLRNGIGMKTYLIGLIIAEGGNGAADLTRFVERFAANNGYSIVLCNADKENPEKCLKILVSKKVDGIIFYSHDAEITKRISSADTGDIPKIALNCNASPLLYSVYCDYRRAAYLATKHLIENGHKSIGCILCRVRDALSGMVEIGYTKALFENNLTKEDQKVFSDVSGENAGKFGALHLIKTDVTAILCQTSEVACYAYQTLHDCGIEVPKNLSVISAIDSHLSEMLTPPLTAMQIPFQKLAEETVSTLISMIEEKQGAHPVSLELPPLLVDRSSVAKPFESDRHRGLGKKIIVVGSMNIDEVVSVPRMPVEGETIMALGCVLSLGGKGANQAVGIGKLGGTVYAIGHLGGDDPGKELYANLVKNSVKADGVLFDSSNLTGKAYINVSKKGESSIVVYPGANKLLDVKQVKQFSYLFSNAEYCLLSMEISNEVVEYCINVCKKNNVQVILKPSAALNIGSSVLKKIDYLVPNEKEINLLIPGDGSIEEKADVLFRQGVKNVIVTLSEKGCYLKNHEYSLFFPSTRFTPLDTTGAADAFISALAVSLSERNDILYSICFATYSAGISITRAGAQSALPDRMMLDYYQDGINDLYEKIRSGFDHKISADLIESGE